MRHAPYNCDIRWWPAWLSSLENTVAKVQSAEFLSYDRFCLYTCKSLGLNMVSIWMGVPLVIIHFNGIFHETNHLFWGSWKPLKLGCVLEAQRRYFHGKLHSAGPCCVTRSNRRWTVHIWTTRKSRVWAEGIGWGHEAPSSPRSKVACGNHGWKNPCLVLFHGKIKWRSSTSTSSRKLVITKLWFCLKSAPETVIFHQFSPCFPRHDAQSPSSNGQEIIYGDRTHFWEANHLAENWQESHGAPQNPMDYWWLLSLMSFGRCFPPFWDNPMWLDLCFGSKKKRGKRPQTVWGGGKRILHYNMDDDDDDYYYYYYDDEEE